MEGVCSTDQKEGIVNPYWKWLKAVPGKLTCQIVEFAKTSKALGQEDPRRIIHSLKVGLAITLVSLFYYFEPLYDGFGVSAMWAVLTVFVVFEFSVGATLTKGLNRGLATFLGAILGFGAHHLAVLSGQQLEPILLGLFVFLLAAFMTFIRFFPRMKAKYDYGLLVFILTFCLISVSGYRDDEVLVMAHKRVSTIFLGGFTALLVCIFICPVWAGLDLHNLVADNIEQLASSIECFGSEFFKPSTGVEFNKTLLQGYTSVLHSKQPEESLSNFAKWEPCHGKFRFGHPWNQYLKIGNLTRKCAYKIDTLCGYLQQEIQVSEEILIAGTKVSLESSKALKEVAMAMKTMTTPRVATIHIAKSTAAAKNLKSMLSTDLCKETEFAEVMPIVSMVFLLDEVVSCCEEIGDSVHELASVAGFKNVKPQVEVTRKPSLRRMQSRSSVNVPQSHHVITVE